MAKTPKHYVLKPETGYYHLEGQDVHIKVGTTNAVANTALLAFEAIKSPLTINVVVPPTGGDPAEAINDPRAKRSGLGFAIALIVVSILTVGAFIAMLVMSATFPDNPNAFQSKAFDISVDVLLTGFGALIGLITGKAT